MPRARTDDEPPDRLAAVLEELDEVRTRPTWTPDEADIAAPRSRLRNLFARRPRDRSLISTPAGRHHAGGSAANEIRPHTPLVRPPSSLFDAQVAPSRLALIGVLTLIVVAAVILGGRVLVARATAAPHPVAPAASSTPHSALRPGHTQAAAAASPTTATAPVVLLVQVVGQVHKPGVVEVPQGARVKDAVQAAGGAKRSADLSRVNMARKVVDGEQIQVPKPGEAVTPPPAPPGGSEAESGQAAPGTDAVVDLNTANEQTLEGLPGIGPVLASRILDWRKQNGRFSSVDELAEVSGIGDKMLAQLRPHVRV